MLRLRKSAPDQHQEERAEIARERLRIVALAPRARRRAGCAPSSAPSAAGHRLHARPCRRPRPPACRARSRRRRARIAGARHDADAEGEEGVAQVLAPAEGLLEADAMRRRRPAAAGRAASGAPGGRGPWRSRAARAPWSSASAGRRSARPPKPRPSAVSAWRGAGRRASLAAPRLRRSSRALLFAAWPEPYISCGAARKARRGLGRGAGLGYARGDARIGGFDGGGGQTPRGGGGGGPGARSRAGRRRSRWRSTRRSCWRWTPRARSTARSARSSARATRRRCAIPT